MPEITLITAINVVVARMMPSSVRKLRNLLPRSDWRAPRTGRITHEDPDLKDSFTQSGQMGEVTAEMKYSTGDELAIAGKAQFNGADVTLNDRWSLAADGKTLTIQRHVTSPMGETDRKIVLEKQ